MKYEKELTNHKEHIKHEFQGLVNSVIGSLNNETNVILPGNSNQIEQNIAHSINVYQRPRTLLERNANALKERKFVDVLFLAGKEEKVKDFKSSPHPHFQKVPSPLPPVNLI
uniref:Uncharacterized protein n=1 Tax=Acrobeloides nanus TaxID=290746 RepID=A0A914DDM9_9BILA